MMWARRIAVLLAELAVAYTVVLLIEFTLRPMSKADWVLLFLLCAVVLPYIYGFLGAALKDLYGYINSKW